MKRILYIIPALLILASCARELAHTEVCESSLNLGITFNAREAGSGSVQEPVINSMRVLIFYGAAQTQPEAKSAGTLLFNTFYAFGFNTTRQTGKYNVALANQIVLPKSDCRDYDIYVVLNEEGFCLSGATPTDLHTALGDFAGNETALQNILSTPAVYTEVLKNVDEPAFLISGCKAVTFANGELGSGKPVTIDGADGFNRGRSMAQIVINKITSEPPGGVVDYSSTDVPRIFVKSVTLENIPNTIAWSDEDGSTDGTAATKMASQPVGAANSDGYYTREWYGHITRTISNLYAQKVQYTDAKLYRTGNNADPNKNTKWSFNVKPYRATDPAPGGSPYPFPYAYGKDQVPAGVSNDENALLTLGVHDDGDPLFNDDAVKILYEEVKQGKDQPPLIQGQLPALFSATQDGNPEMSENISYTSYEVTGVQNETKDGKTKTSIGPATMSDDYWTVRLGDKFYVPENIQETSTNATCLHVTLAIAQPLFSFSLNKEAGNRVATEDCNYYQAKDDKHGIEESGVKADVYQSGYHYVDPTTLPAPSSLPDEEDLTYSYYLDETPVANMKNKSLLQTNGHIVWADDESKELEIPSSKDDRKKYSDPDNHGQYHVYIDGFNRRTEGVQSNIVVNETLRGAYFDWNVNAATKVYDFVIPVNNNLGGDGDYSVRRNTRYTVTLYVNGDTYSSLDSKAGGCCPFTLTAKVKTEIVSCDEE